MRQTKKNYGKKQSVAASKQIARGNEDNVLRCNYIEKFMRPTEFPTRLGKMTYIRKDYHHIIANMIPVISNGTISISSYIDHVLTEHFKRYGKVIDDIYMEKLQASTSVSLLVTD